MENPAVKDADEMTNFARALDTRFKRSVLTHPRWMAQNFIGNKVFRAMDEGLDMVRNDVLLQKYGDQLVPSDVRRGGMYGVELGNKKLSVSYGVK